MDNAAKIAERKSGIIEPLIDIGLAIDDCYGSLEDLEKEISGILSPSQPDIIEDKERDVTCSPVGETCSNILRRMRNLNSTIRSLIHRVDL